MRVYKVLSWFFIPLLLASCSQKSEIRHGNLRLRWNDKLQTQVILNDGKEDVITPGWQSSEYLVGKGFQATEFQLKDIQYPEVNGLAWKTAAIIRGEFAQNEIRLEKVVTYQYTDSLSDFLLVKVAYINTGEKPVEITHWYNHAYTLPAAGDHPAFWSFQGSSDPSRHDWIMPIDSAFYRENYMGMNASDYGGGIPMIDIWRKKVGLAVGHGSTRPESVSLPVKTDSAVNQVSINVSGKFSKPLILNHGDTLSIIPTWIYVHRGDCYSSLRNYAKYLHLQGIQFPSAEPGAYEPVWCAWGYGREATREEILNTLPKVKELGFTWVDIDDGYQQAEGDWDVNPRKYPRGDSDMRSLVDEIHKAGLKAKIWWAPLAVDPGSKLLKDNSEITLVNEEGKYQNISWWDSYYMSPSHPLTRKHTIQVLNKFLSVWDYDGLKVDGQHINCIPPDYNATAGYKTPEEAPFELPDFFKLVWETARKIKPDAVVQLCPCGCVMSAFHLPYMNQAVASDPLSSWQIRSKAFVYKAMAPHLAYYGDHVELSTGGLDFASQIGVGGVPGSKFTWPADHPGSQESFLLTPEKEELMKKWISIYRQKMLSKGEYLGGLYDIGYDRPEAHVIRKADTLYYAFYAPSFEGALTFKGLAKEKKYKVYDYTRSLTLGMVSGELPTMNITFENHLLVELTPILNP
jgi:alpha-galactosidase